MAHIKGIATLVAVTRGADPSKIDMELAVLNMADGERHTQVFAFGVDPDSAQVQVEIACIAAAKAFLQTLGVTFSGAETVRVFPALA